MTQHDVYIPNEVKFTKSLFRSKGSLDVGCSVTQSGFVK